MSGRPKSPHPPQSKCGSGLAREGGVSAPTKPPDPPPSQASQLPPLWVTDQNLRTQRNPNVGAGLLAKAVYLPQPSRLTHRHRRQASSPTNERQSKIPHPPQSNCGSRACPRWHSFSQPSTSGRTALPSTRTPAFFRLCFNIWDANLYIEIFQKMGL